MKIAFALLALLINLQAGLCAAESSIVRKVEPELAPDLDLLTKIKNLPPNTWLKLPPFKVTGDLDWLERMKWKEMLTRGPFGRDYSGKAAWMPDRKRAIYTGGGHNVLPLNDVWEYDLASNTWICLYGADQPAQGKPAEWMKENLVIRGGVLQTQRGGPPRLSHSFDGWNYDSERRLAFMPESLRGAVFVDHKVVAAGLGLSDAELAAQWKPAPYFLTFDPYEKKWGYETENVPACGRDPSARYVPHLKSWWLSSGGTMALYDPSTHTAKKLSLQGRGGGYGSSTAYDPETRSMVVITPPSKERAGATWIYSLDTDTWKTVQATAATGGSSATGFFDYDSVSKQFVLYTNRPQPSHWIYNPTANEWTQIACSGDVPESGPAIGYYDPERDVLVHYNSRNVYVCRLKLPSK